MTKDSGNPTEWITTAEAAELTKYSPVTLRQYGRQGRIKARKRGRDWFLDKSSVLAYVQEMERLGTTKHDPTRHKQD